MSPAGTLLVRADAAIETGTGHVMRSLALAQAWQDTGGRAVFVSAQMTAALRARVGVEGFDLADIAAEPGTSADAAQTVAEFRRQQCDWIVVDGYSFGAEYQRQLKDAGLKTVFVDDFGHAPRYFADIVLNQNVTATPDLYSNREQKTRLLLGTRYCLLRREFSRWRGWWREISPECRRVLVLMGGSDPGNIARRVVEALATNELRHLEIIVVAGGSNPNLPALEKAVSASARAVLKTGASNVSELMAESDLAVSAAGSTCWELCLMGLPALLIDVAGNQTAIARELARRGCAIHAGGVSVSVDTIRQRVSELAASAESRRSLSRQSSQLVDGHGAARVVSILQGKIAIQLRPVRAQDERLLWEWANDPEVRAASFSSAPIPWETHAKWFAEKRNGDKNLFLIAENPEGFPVGQIRFDVDGADASLNFSIAREKRGLGLAAMLVEEAVREVWAQTRCARIHALVKPDNLPSAKTFEKAGFTRMGTERVHEHDVLHFVRARN